MVCCFLFPALQASDEEDKSATRAIPAHLTTPLTGSSVNFNNAVSHDVRSMFSGVWLSGVSKRILYFENKVSGNLTEHCIMVLMFLLQAGFYF